MTEGDAIPRGVGVIPGSDVGTFWRLVCQAAERHPDRVLLADDHGRSLTGASLRETGEVVAAGFAALGIGRGSRVSWQLPTTLEAMVVMVALARLGAVQNPVIPVMRERDVALVVDQVNAEFLLVPEEWRGFAHGAMARDLATSRDLRVVICDHATDPSTLGGALRLPAGDPATLPAPGDPASGDVRWIYHSSGTTSVPKGIQHTDRSVMASASGVVNMLDVRADDVFPLAIPVSHIGGMAMLTASLVKGMRLVCFDVFDPATTPERMAAHGPTVLGSAVPFFLAFMAAQQRHGSAPLYPRLRIGVAGGAPLPVEVCRAVRETLGISGICNSWGLTEVPVITFATPRDPADVLDRTVGRPNPGVEVRAVGDDEQVLPPGAEGELRVKGPQTFVGYVDPALDVEAFDADGFFRTGDVGVVEADGRIRVTGRLKEIIIRNAENISALEVEELLFRYPGVVDVAVIGVPDPRTVERVCAVIVAEPGTDVSLETIVAYCKRAGMTPFKIPERVEVVDEIPRNALGKALKNDLRARFG